MIREYDTSEKQWSKGMENNFSWSLLILGQGSLRIIHVRNARENHVKNYYNSQNSNPVLLGGLLVTRIATKLASPIRLWSIQSNDFYKTEYGISKSADFSVQLSHLTCSSCTYSRNLVLKTFRKHPPITKQKW